MKYLTYIIYFLLQLSNSDEAQQIRARQELKPIAPITASTVDMSLAANSDSIFINEILWRNNRKLNWQDFTAEPDHYSNFSAITSTYLEEEHGCSDDGDFIYHVRAVFVKDLSWSRDHYSADLLAHEQIHFDITEYHARKLRLYFESLQNPCGMPQELIEFTVDSLFNEMAKAQMLYDEHTYHGLDKSNQKTWADFVDRQLEKYEDYQNK